jgi:hypothetical protein
MYDKIDFFIPYNSEDFGKDDIPIVIGNLELERQEIQKRIYYEVFYKKIRFRLYENGLYISNSISSIIYGNNTFDLTYLQLCRAIDEICSIINQKPSDLQIKSFEFGLTIQVSIKVKRILKRLLIHKNKEPKCEYRQTHLTSVKFFHFDYTLKFYDKAFVEKIERRVDVLKGNWLRSELQLKKKNIPKHIQTAEDLKNIPNIKLLFSILISQWRAVYKMPFINHSEHTKENLCRIYAISNPLYQEDRLDYVTKDAVRKEQQRHKKDLEKVGDFSVFDEIEKGLNEKFNYLIIVP